MSVDQALHVTQVSLKFRLFLPLPPKYRYERHTAAYLTCFQVWVYVCVCMYVGCTCVTVINTQSYYLLHFDTLSTWKSDLTKMAKYSFLWVLPGLHYASWYGLVTFTEFGNTLAMVNWLVSLLGIPTRHRLCGTICSTDPPKSCLGFSFSLDNLIFMVSTVFTSASTLCFTHFILVYSFF